MGNYLLRRLLVAVPSLLGISLILFVLLALAPGDPFGELATNPNVPPEVREALRIKFGMNDPILLRYMRWLIAMLHGDWGFSFASRVNVDTLILQRIPTTLYVVGTAQILALAVALPVGVLAARRPYSIFDQIANTFAFIGFSLPTFFTGLLLILIFSVNLGWLPFVYRADLQATGWQWWWESIKQAIMPITVLGLYQAASYTRYVRSAVLDVIKLDYVTTARAKGPRRAQGHRQARGAQRADSGGDLGGAADADRVRRRHRHRADLPHSGHRLAADQRDPRQRHACHYGRDLRVRLPRRSLQPHRRHFVWLA
ncbi:peptide/nickel transport system permease protein [Bradyrhizobium sp. USDA 4369]